MPQLSNRTTSLLTGAAYLGVVLCGLFAEFFVRGSLVVGGDAEATARNIAASATYFGSGVAADALMVALDVAVALGLYRLLAPFGAGLVRVATAARLVQATILAFNLGNLLSALWASSADTPALRAGALASLETHALMYDVGLIAFGLACITLGLLTARARAPRAISFGLATTGIVYLVGSYGALFAPALSAILDPLYAIAIVVESAVAIWLMARSRRWDELEPAPRVRRALVSA